MRNACLFAAAGIAVTLLVGCQDDAVWISSTPGPANVTTVAAIPTDAETLVVHVPEMMCPFACWPAVQKDLVAQPGVLDVELAPQKDENAIDNPKVFVRVAEGFDADAAVASLADAGFKGSEVAAAN
ncbi:MAG TPA: hypothetical protein VGN57_19770 [Pirellulaceae bacterium]|jgi:hypothetical protein|nr:hypothetical protein [Pirellulaceae bacterium]